MTSIDQIDVLADEYGNFIALVGKEVEFKDWGLTEVAQGAGQRTYLVSFNSGHFLNHEITAFQVNELHVVLGPVSSGRDDLVEGEREDSLL